MIKVGTPLLRRVGKADQFDASACMNCGVCTAICPMGIDILPRTLFRYALLGMEDKVFGEGEAIFSCLLCRMCESTCPADVQIAENIRLIRYYINNRLFKL
jgi:heterodisulfide reductase subunit C